MSPNPTTTPLGRSPLEIVAVPLLLGPVIGIGMLWGAGVVIGSLLGSTLPGSAGAGIAMMLASFPDIGAAWEPPIPSPFVWTTAVTVVGLLAPLGWKLMTIGNLHDQGAQWATTTDLRRAQLLVSDGTSPHSIPEAHNRKPDDAD